MRGWWLRWFQGPVGLKIKGAQFGYIRVNASNIRRDYCQAHVFREEIAHFHHQKASQSLERAKTIGSKNANDKKTGNFFILEGRAIEEIYDSFLSQYFYIFNHLK